jgi:hypothetical protein
VAIYRFEVDVGVPGVAPEEAVFASFDFFDEEEHG